MRWIFTVWLLMIGLGLAFMITVAMLQR
jgi:hypothetical protein